MPDYNYLVHSLADNIESAIEGYDQHLRDHHGDALTVGAVRDGLEEAALRCDALIDAIEEDEAAVRAEWEGVE